MIRPTKLIVAVAFLFFAVNSFAYQKETRKVDSFDKISLGTHADLYLTIGSKQSVVLEGDEDDLEDIKTEVKGGTLRIGNKSSGWSSWNNGKIKVYITVPSVEELRVSGSGDLYGESVIKSENLKLAISGSGNMELEVESSQLSISVAGSGNAELKGSTREFNATISGSGKVDAEDLVARTADVRISGSGSLRIEVEEELESSISGSGSVYYAGDPDRVNSSAAGSGKVKRIN